MRGGHNGRLFCFQNRDFEIVETNLGGYKIKMSAGSVVVAFDNGICTFRHDFGFTGDDYYIAAIANNTANDGVIIYRTVNIDGNNTTFYAQKPDGSPATPTWMKLFAVGK